MQEKRTVQPETSLWEQLLKQLSLIKEIGRRILLWLFVLTFILFAWHIIPIEILTHEGLARQIILSVLVVLGAGIIELLFDTKESVEKVSKDVKQLRENASTRLQSLQGCMEDLSGELDRISSDDRMLVKHLGLNMEHAWDYLKKYLLEHKNVNNVEVRLLMLPIDSREIVMHSNHPLPNEVDAWCKSVESRIKLIDAYLKAQKPHMKKLGKHIRIDIKQYRILPAFHGFSISGPLNLCFLSVCRWKHDKEEVRDWDYDWAQFSYHTIRDDTTDSGVEDLKNIFNGHFEYLWETSGDPVVSFSTKDSQATSPDRDVSS